MINVASQRGKDGVTAKLIGQEIKLGPNLTLYSKINYQWILYFDILSILFENHFRFVRNSTEISYILYPVLCYDLLDVLCHSLNLWLENKLQRYVPLPIDIRTLAYIFSIVIKIRKLVLINYISNMWVLFILHHCPTNSLICSTTYYSLTPCY